MTNNQIVNLLFSFQIIANVFMSRLFKPDNYNYYYEE